MIQEWLNTYTIKNTDDATNALREVMQEIALAGLERSGFYEKAAFYGGTALRIFYGLNRFSEDLDFSLLQPNENFSFEKHLKAIEEEFSALGMTVSIQEKQKSAVSSIESAFLKSDTTWRELVLESILPQIGVKHKAQIKIKIEVDTNPPLGFATEERLLLKPFSFYVKCFAAPDLFAGKMHALLFRKWKNNVKGRDWFDMEWYVRKGIPVNLNHFLQRAIASEDWQEKTITQSEFLQLLSAKIERADIPKIKADIIRFIPEPNVLDIWSVSYFQDLIKHLKFS